MYELLDGFSSAVGVESAAAAGAYPGGGLVGGNGGVMGVLHDPISPDLQQMMVALQRDGEPVFNPSSPLIQTMPLVFDAQLGDDGASTVAIDNKIEQAMDLVKSHLMFAVREEVELLKEQISELLEKNSLLEYENAILRANASPETLAQINTPPDSQTTAQSKQATVSSSS